MNPNDVPRTQILRFFYERNAVATSQYGKKGSALKISDAKRALKEQHGLSQQQVVSNLTYLIDKGWVNKREVQKTVSVSGGTIPSTVAWYEISSAGIDKIEGESEFKVGPRFAGININATGQNVVTLGDGNVVQAKHATLHGELDELRRELIASASLTEEQKFTVVADIETIRDQLAKPEPNRRVLGSLWHAIEATATIAGVVDLVQKIAPFIQALVGA